MLIPEPRDVMESGQAGRGRWKHPVREEVGHRRGLDRSGVQEREEMVAGRETEKRSTKGGGEGLAGLEKQVQVPVCFIL